MTDPNIERCIERVKAGCIDDYAMIVTEYRERLRSAIGVWCPPGVDVNEISHLVFVEAYRQLARYVPGTNFFAWLCAIGRNRLMTEFEAHRRRAKNQSNYLQDVLTRRLELAAEREGPWDDSRFQFLDECLKALSPEERSLIEHRYSQGQTIAAIGEAIGRTVSAVSVRLFTLRQKLRDCIERKGRRHHVQELS